MTMKAAACPRCGEALSLKADSSTIHCAACGASFKAKSRSKQSRDTADRKKLDTTDGKKLENAEASGHVSGGNSVSGDAELSMRTLDRFELKRLLGEGGFGKVFLAFDPRLERDVAIKVPTFSNQDRRRVARFRSEARTAAILRHPNIVQTLESGETDGTLFIVSQYVEGAPLTARLESGELDFVQTSVWIESIARALHYAHQNGIVHRDIKPDNILIDENGEPQIMDFGLAKQEGRQGVTQDDAIVGTLHYMSPEQARGEDDAVSATSDQYSLGAILYEMLSGSKPFDGASHVILTQVADPQIEPESPRKRRASIPKDLEVICLKAIAKRVGDRYSSCEELADDLRRWRNDLPITARRSTIVEKTYRFCRRNPVVSSLTAALAIAFAISVGLHLELRQRVEEIGDLETKNEAALKKNEQLKDETVTLVRAKEEAEAKTQRAVQDTKQATKSAEEATKKAEEAKEAKEKAEGEKDDANRDLQYVQVSLANEQSKLKQVKTEFEYVGYQARLQLAAQNIRSKNYPRARTELARCEPKLRGWEWRYLDRKSNPSVWELQFESEVLGTLLLENRDNGKRPQIAIATKDGVQLIDAETGQKAKELAWDSPQGLPIKQPQYVPASVRWNPLKTDRKNQFLALTSLEGQTGVRTNVWELGDGETVFSRSNTDVIFAGKAGPLPVPLVGDARIEAARKFPDQSPKQLSALLRRFTLPHNEEDFVEFTDRGEVRLQNRFCVQSSTGRFRSLGASKYVELSGDRTCVLAIILVGDGEDKEYRLVSISNRREGTSKAFQKEIRIVDPDPAGRYCLSDDGKHVATILSGNAHLFDAETGLREGVLGGANDIELVKFGDVNRLLTIDRDQATLIEIDVKEHVILPRVQMQSVAFFPKSPHLVSVDEFGRLRRHLKGQAGKFDPQTVREEDPKNLTNVVFSGDGLTMITHGNTTSHFEDFSSDTGREPLRMTRENGHNRNRVLRLKPSPQGMDLLTVDEIGGTIVWKFEEGQHQPFPLRSDIELQPKGDAIWIDDQRVLSTTIREKSDDAASARCPIWNIQTGEIESWVSLSGRILRLNPTRDRVAVGTEQGSLAFYRVQSQDGKIQFVKEDLGDLQLFNGPVKTISFFPDAKRVVVTGDEQLKVLEPFTGYELLSLDSPVGDIESLSVSSDGRTVAACGTRAGTWILETRPAP